MIICSFFFDANACWSPARSQVAIAVDQLDGSSFLRDIEVMNINDSESQLASGRERHTRDVNNFFSQPYVKDDGSLKKYCSCNLCS